MKLNINLRVRYVKKYIKTLKKTYVLILLLLLLIYEGNERINESYDAGSKYFRLRVRACQGIWIDVKRDKTDLARTSSFERITQLLTAGAFNFEEVKTKFYGIEVYRNKEGTISITRASDGSENFIKVITCWRIELCLEKWRSQKFQHRQWLYDSSRL